jgi:hypothetical protein
MEQISDIRVEQILQQMIRKEDIKLKTHIIAPVEISSLRALEALFVAYSMKNAAVVLGTWLNEYEQYMVSWKRLSREEIIKAVSAVLAARMEERQTTGQKLMGVKK